MSTPLRNIDLVHQSPQSAIALGEIEFGKVLLKAGTDVSSPPKGKGGRSPVQAAAESGDISLVKLLLESSAEIMLPRSRQHRLLKGLPWS